MNIQKSYFNLVLFFTVFLFSQFATAQSVVDVYQHNAGSFSLYKSEIDSITFERQTSGDNYNQVLWTKNKAIRMNLTEKDSLVFSEKLLPDAYYLTDGIDNWSCVWLSRDGSSFWAVKDTDNDDVPEQITMLVPDDTGQKSNLTLISYQPDGSLKSVYVNGNLMTVRRMYDNMIDVTIVLADTLTYSCDSIPLPNINESLTRSWTTNNIWRNGIAVGKILLGAAEFISGGVGATLSLPAGFIGGAGASFGLKSMYDGLNKGLEGLNMLKNSASAEQVNTNRIVEDIFENFVGSIDGELGERFKKIEKPLSGISAIADLLNTALDYLDEKYGWSLTLEDLEDNYYYGLVNIGYKLKDKAAIVKGYVAQEITKTMYGTPINHTYGFIIYDSNNSSNYQIQSYDNKGGGHFDHEFKGLVLGNTYSYRIFYKDNDNHVTAYSDPESFTMPLAVTGDAIPIDGKGTVKYQITGSVKGMNSGKGNAYVVYSSESNDPQLGVHQHVNTGLKTDGDFTIEIPNIDPTKTYHYKTCLSLDGEEFYGDAKVFGLNMPMGLTYEKIEEFSTSEGIVYVNYEVKAHFRPNELQSAIGVVLYQGNEAISRYPMKMVQAGNEKDVYAGNIILGVERTDFNLDYANYRAATKDLSLALCVNMEIKGEVVGIVFDENKTNFTIVYDQKPDIVFTKASITDINKYTDEDGSKIAVSTYSYDVTITGAFWMTNAIFKSKGDGWKGSLADIPFSILNDNDLPGMPGLLTVINYEQATSSDLKLRSYFDIMLANGNIKKSSNHLEWTNNGKYITGVKIVSGGFSSARMKNKQSSENRIDSETIVLHDSSAPLEQASMTLPERWIEVPTLSKLRNNK